MMLSLSRPLKRLVAKNEFYLLLVFVTLGVIVSIVNPRFLSASNIFAVLQSYAFIGILAIGFLIVLISGGIDISFTATATVAQYIMAVALAANHNTPILFIILIPIVVGTILGSFNALLIHYLKAPSIIITIATLNAYYGILQYVSNGQWIYNFPQWFRNFPKIILIKFANEEGAIFGLSVITALWFLVAGIGFVLLRHTRLGRHIYAKGGNLEGARRAGLNILGLRLFSYSFMGFIAGIGAIVHAMVTQTVAPNALLGQEFDVLTAVVLGGASIFGGIGSISGTLLGVGLVALIKNALTLMRVPEFWHQVFIGLVLLVSVSISAVQRTVIQSKERTINVV